MTDKKKFIIGSRGSKLSLAYSGHVKNLLIKSSTQFDDSSIEIKIIKTSGDIFQNKRISEILTLVSQIVDDQIPNLVLPDLDMFENGFFIKREYGNGQKWEKKKPTKKFDRIHKNSEYARRMMNKVVQLIN